MKIVRSCAPATALLFVVVAASGCQNQADAAEPTGGRSRRLAGSEMPEDDRGRCDVDDPNHEASEYDTSGDDYPDVRRVFRRVGQPPVVRLILACREVDLNHDGIKDVVRYYNDEGRPLREEADRDFDGTMDTVRFFQNGRIVREEVDLDGDGRVDAKYYYERGVRVRGEVDSLGRSTPNNWRPDQWLYYENGRLVRMGTNVDGDAEGTIDRWDRDAERASSTPDEEAEAEGADSDEEGAGEDGETAGGEDPGEDAEDAGQ